MNAANQLLVATLLTGLFAGLGATGFHYIADVLFELLLHAAERRSLIVLLPTLGLLLVGLVLQAFPIGRKGGMSEVLEAIEHHAGVIPFGRMLNVLLSAFVLAFGGSVGPEGPMVQMGAVFGSVVGQRCGLTKARLQMMVRAGAAAGIAAGFRSPAGGVLLTLEVFGARMNLELAAIAVAATIGYVTRIAILGDAFPFRLAETPQHVPLPGLLLVAPLMGVFAAPAGHLFIRMFERAKTVLPAQWPLAGRVCLGGFLIGCIGIFFPQIMSAGYPVIGDAITGKLTVGLLAWLCFLKMFATSVTFGSGAVGGLFAPTLVIGAMYGGAWGYGFHAIWPEAVPQPGLFVLLGMIVMFGSIVKGYWSGLLMIADMSGCYHQLILPGVIAGGISFVLSWRMYPKSIFGLSLDPYKGKPDKGKPLLEGVSVP